MSASPERSALFTTSTVSPLKELDVSAYYPYLDPPSEELDVSAYYPYLDLPLEESDVSPYYHSPDSLLEEPGSFTYYPYLGSFLSSDMIPSDGLGGEGLGPDQLDMPKLVQDYNDWGHVVLYEEPDQPPREYFFPVKDNHFSLLTNQRFLAESRFLDEEFEVFDIWLGKFVGLPSLSKWKSCAINPFLVVKIAGLPKEACPGIELLLLEIDDAIEAYLNDYEPIDTYLEG
ncbi:hypothetical protein NP233_g333 [Leucocoprinus birnbaumii]|uniref:Uncharacterized protein n=1 Tax=Leucocoprinus birnbaumii TaxID=56174 RepID=A0AAD5W6Y1_9AGAR|nr:hypothetical protein NP233_g333 [Leucocoprinus birnbaumii]